MGTNPEELQRTLLFTMDWMKLIKLRPNLRHQGASPERNKVNMC